MTALAWILVVACWLAGVALGWLIHSAVVEHAQFREWEQRDREWAEQHGIPCGEFFMGDPGYRPR